MNEMKENPCRWKPSQKDLKQLFCCCFFNPICSFLSGTASRKKLNDADFVQKEKKLHFFPSSHVSPALNSTEK